MTVVKGYFFVSISWHQTSSCEPNKHPWSRHCLTHSNGVMHSHDQVLTAPTSRISRYAQPASNCQNKKLQLPEVAFRPVRPEASSKRGSLVILLDRRTWSRQKNSTVQTVQKEFAWLWMMLFYINFVYSLALPSRPSPTFRPRSVINGKVFLEWTRNCQCPLLWLCSVLLHFVYFQSLGETPSTSTFQVKHCMKTSNYIDWCTVQTWGQKWLAAETLSTNWFCQLWKKPAALDTHGTRKLHESIIQSPVVGRGIWFGIFWQLKSALSWSSRPRQGSLTSSLPNPTTPRCARAASQLPQKMRLKFPSNLVSMLIREAAYPCY